MLAACIAVFGASNWFAEHTLRCNGFRHISESEGQQTTKQWPWPFLGASLGLWSALELLLSPLWAGHCRLSYKIHLSSHITIWPRNGSLLLHRIREDNNSKWYFWFPVSSWGTHLSSFFTFSICFKCQMTIEWQSLSSLATSPVVVKGSALMTGLNWLLSISGGWPLCSSSSRLSSPLQNFLNHHCTVCSSAVPGPNLLMFQSCRCCFMTHFELE